MCTIILVILCNFGIVLWTQLKVLWHLLVFSYTAPCEEETNMAVESAMTCKIGLIWRHMKTLYCTSGFFCFWAQFGKWYLSTCIALCCGLIPHTFLCYCTVILICAVCAEMIWRFNDSPSMRKPQNSTSSQSITQQAERDLIPTFNFLEVNTFLFQLLLYCCLP